MRGWAGRADHAVDQCQQRRTDCTAHCRHHERPDLPERDQRDDHEHRYEDGDELAEPDEEPFEGVRQPAEQLEQPDVEVEQRLLRGLRQHHADEHGDAGDEEAEQENG